jgi:hypothetical protein
MRNVWALFLCSCVGVAGGGGDPGDAGCSTGGHGDAGLPAPDAGVPDAGVPDAGPPLRSLELTVESTGMPVAGAMVSIDAAHQGATDASGKITFAGLPQIALMVSVNAMNCTSVTKAIDATSTTATVELTCTPPLPPPPSADAVRAVRSNWADLWDAQNRVILTAYLPSLMEAGDTTTVEDWIARLKAKNDTHVVVQLSAPTYPGYPIAGTDFTRNLPAFKKHLLELIRRGFIPLVMLGDGQTATAHYPGTTGSDWLAMHLTDIATALRADVDLAPYCLWSPGWRLMGSGGPQGGDWDGTWWSLQQIETALSAMRTAFGDNAQLALELGQGYIHAGNGPDDWTQPGMDTLDVFLVDMPQPVLPDTTGAQQIAARVLGPAATNIGAGNGGPWYFSAPRARGPLTIVAFEDVAYGATHGQLDATAVQAASDALYNFGFRNLGNGQATGH